MKTKKKDSHLKICHVDLIFYVLTLGAYVYKCAKCEASKINPVASRSVHRQL